MKNKNLIVLFSMIMLLTGCTATYNLKITDNTITEKISLFEKKELVDQEIADEQLNNIFSNTASNLKKYNITKKEKNNQIIYNLSQTYFLSDMDSVNNIRIIKECFDAYNIVYLDDEKTSYILQTSKGFHCLNYDYNEIDSVKINIEVDNEVLNNNADKVKGNVYTWYIDKNNYADKYVSLEFKKGLKETSSNKKNKFDFKIILITIVIIIGTLVLILLYALGLNQKRNKL